MNIRRIWAAVALCAGIFSSSQSYSSDNWANIQPAYNARQNSLTIRAEGGSTLVDQLRFYSYGDVDPSKNHRTDLETLYNETRLSYSLGRVHQAVSNVGVAAEYNGGTGIEDIVRFGTVWTPQTVKDNFTMFRVYPIETSGAVGPQVDIYISQRFTDWFSASFLAEGNIRPRVVYTELELDFTYKRAALFGQSRVVLQMKENPNLQPIVGVKYTF